MRLPGSRIYTNVGIEQQNEFTPFGESAAGHTFERYDTIQNPNAAFWIITNMINYLMMILMISI